MEEKRGRIICRKITPWMLEGDSGMDSKKHQIWPFWTGMEGEAPHRDADYRQKHRQADRRLISDSVNLCSNSWSMIPQ